MGKRSFSGRPLATLLLAFVSAIVPISAPAEDWGVADPVRHALERCLAKPQTRSTLEIDGCYGTAVRAYDAVIAKTYDGIMRHTDAQTRRAVRASQTAWLAYRKSALVALRAPWSTDRGTLVTIEADQALVTALHARAFELHLISPGFGGESPSL